MLLIVPGRMRLTHFIVVSPCWRTNRTHRCYATSMPRPTEIDTTRFGDSRNLAGVGRARYLSDLAAWCVCETGRVRVQVDPTSPWGYVSFKPSGLSNLREGLRCHRRPCAEMNGPSARQSSVDCWRDPFRPPCHSLSAASPIAPPQTQPHRLA